MSDDPLAAAYAESRERSALARATYAALKATGQLASHRVLSYRCARRCLLLDVVLFPQGVILHQPGYKLSPRVNEATSNDAGRARNTEDRERRWRAQTFLADDCANVSLACDHLQERVLDKAQVQADLDAGHAEVVVRQV